MRRATKLEGRRLLIAVVAAVVSPVILLHLIYRASDNWLVFNDLPAFYAAAKLVLAGQAASVYRLDTMFDMQHQIFPGLGERALPVPHPPFALFTIAPIGLLSLHSLFDVWTAILFVSLIASVVVLCLTFHLSLKSSLWIFAVLCIYAPTWESLRIGQLSPVILLMLSVAVWAIKSNKFWLAGMMLALAFGKPQDVLPLLIFFAGVGRWKEIKWFLVFLAIMTIASMMLFGVDSYLNCLRFLVNPYREVWLQPQIHATVRGQLLRIFPVYSPAVNTFCSALMLMICGAIFVMGRRYKNSAHWLEFGLIVVLSLGLFFSPHLYNYELLLLLLSVIPLLAIKAKRSWKLTALYCLVPFLMPIYIPIHYEYILEGGIINPLFFALAMYVGVVAVGFRKNVEPLKGEKAA